MLASITTVSLAILAFQAVSARAIPTNLLGADEILNRADSYIDYDLVNTPAGPISKSKLHAIPEGGSIQQLEFTGYYQPIRILTVNGATIHTVASSRHATSTGSRSRRTLGPGYVAWLYWENNAPNASPIALFTTTWTVPAVPENTTNPQLLYLLNSLKSTSGDSILQPVLQYGLSEAGGGRYWSVASWFIINGEAFFTKAVEVSPGQSLQSIITLTNVTTSDTGAKGYGYNSVFAGIPGTSLSISSPDELTSAWEALEIYDVSGPTDLPRGRTRMTNINVINNNGQRPPVNWTPNSGDINFGTQVIVDGATDGEVDIIYPLQ